MREAAQPERRRQTSDGSTPLMRRARKVPLVTSARFAKWNGRRREGDGATGSPCSEANRALVTAAVRPTYKKHSWPESEPWIPHILESHQLDEQL